MRLARDPPGLIIRGFCSGLEFRVSGLVGLRADEGLYNNGSSNVLRRFILQGSS